MRQLAVACCSLLFAWCAMFGEVARGQVQDDLIVDGAPELPAPQQQFFIQEEAFDQWLYGSYGARGDVDQKLAAQLDVQIADIERVCESHGVPLSELQKKKLRLAARGDIERFDERVAKVRAKFDLLRNDQNRINEIFQDLQPLQMKIQAGLFGQGSLFEKTVSRVLTTEQLKPRNQLVEDRRRFRYRAQIGVSLATMENGLPLLDEQREKLVELLVSETEPPKSFSQYDYYYVMLQITKLPEEKVREILDETQWKLLQPYLNQARGMEQFLRQQELVGEEPGVPGGLF